MKQPELDKLIADADKRAVYRNQVELAKAKYYALNTLYWEGHKFDLTPTLFAYIGTVLTDAPSEFSHLAGFQPHKVSHVLLDVNDEPVLVADLAYFLERMHENHAEAINQYYDVYSRLKKARSSEELIGAS